MRTLTARVRKAIHNVLRDIRGKTTRGGQRLTMWDSVLALHQLYEETCLVQG